MAATPAAWATSAFEVLKSPCSRQENRVTQSFCCARIAAITGRPAARLVRRVNPLATKSIPDVLSEVPALRFGCQQRFIHGPRTLEVSIDVAVVKSQVQLSCAGSIRRGCEHSRLQRHPF